MANKQYYYHQKIKIDILFLSSTLYTYFLNYDRGTDEINLREKGGDFLREQHVCV